MKNTVAFINSPDDHKAEIISEIQNKLNTLGENYRFFPGSGLTSIGFLVIFNKDVKNSEMVNNKIFLGFNNSPEKLSADQDIHDCVFRAKLQSELKVFAKYLDGDKFFKITIIVVYNKEPDSVKIEGISREKTSNEDDLTLFVPIKPRYKLDQVIITADLLQEIKQTILILKKKKILYDDWGFAEIEPKPKAIINFFGPPGTGKTMTAHAIANHLDTNILALNYSDIESKFVGDAPKNLVRAFEAAEKENCILFFDEADSFLGKRITNVSSSSDQAVNSLRSQMLILLENFTGIVIFATNLVSNYDKAFESRIFRHLKFENPDQKSREMIIRKSIPSKVPLVDGALDNQTLEKLVSISESFSGREIKNSILHSLSRALLQERDYVSAEDFIISFEKTRDTRKMLNCEYAPGANDAQKKIELEKRIKENLEKENQIVS